jgi:hypothetical protein
MRLGDALAGVRAAHAAYHSLVRPVSTDCAGGVPPLPEPPRLVLNVALDRGEVLTSTGAVTGCGGDLWG